MTKPSAVDRVHTIFNPPACGVRPGMAAWRVSLNRVIFEANSRRGQLFDIVLLWLILISVAAVMLESVEPIRDRWGQPLRVLEWVLTGLFTIEYVARLVSAGRPLGYTRSFFGIIDLLAVLPTYLSLLVPGAQALIVVRALRVLRIFRLLKLWNLVGQGEVLFSALVASRGKIIVFLATVLNIVVIVGAMLYLIEGPENGFTSIPTSVYWSIVTMTTVGYGDIAPKTPFGQTVAAFVMLLGYAIIAVPTGIVSVEIAQAKRRMEEAQQCRSCGLANHPEDARFCRRCGVELN